MTEALVVALVACAAGVAGALLAVRRWGLPGAPKPALGPPAGERRAEEAVAVATADKARDEAAVASEERRRVEEATVKKEEANAHADKARPIVDWFNDLDPADRDGGKGK